MLTCTTKTDAFFLKASFASSRHWHNNQHIFKSLTFSAMDRMTMTGRKWQLILLFATVAFYFIFLQRLFLHPDSVLSHTGGDDIKNYYTFLYHTANDSSALVFQGMNYPYAEHVVYTDCQPLLSVLLRPFTFLHGHLVGTLHVLLLAFFIVTPLVLYRVFRRVGCSGAWSTASAFAVSVLS